MAKSNETSKKIVPNLKKLPLKEYYNALPNAERVPVIISKPKDDLVEAIAKACSKSTMTAKRWIYGYSVPCLAEKEKIAGILNCPVECLFVKEQEAV